MQKALVALVLASASAAVAAPIAIPNASFDDNAAGYWGAPEWATAGDGGPVQEILAGSMAGKHGTNYLQLSLEGGADGSPPTETGYQFSGDLGTFQPNTTYTLTVAMCHGYGWNPSDLMKGGIGFATGTTPASIVGSQLYSMRSDGSLGDYITVDSFTDKTFILTTGNSDPFLGQPIRVALVLEHGGQYFRGVRFDNVRLDATAVPEPAVLGLLSSACLLVLRRYRTA